MDVALGTSRLLRQPRATDVPLLARLLDNCRVAGKLERYWSHGFMSEAVAAIVVWYFAATDAAALRFALVDVRRGSA